jgi:hypothetical protein
MTQRARAPAQPGFGRRRLIYHAWIKIPGHRPMPCTVISRTGNKALITFSEAAPAAHEFKLKIDGSSTELDCEVYYRKPSVLGVRLAER